MSAGTTPCPSSRTTSACMAPLTASWGSHRWPLMFAQMCVKSGVCSVSPAERAPGCMQGTILASLLLSMKRAGQVLQV